MILRHPYLPVYVEDNNLSVVCKNRTKLMYIPYLFLVFTKLFKSITRKRAVVARASIDSTRELKEGDEDENEKRSDERILESSDKDSKRYEE